MPMYHAKLYAKFEHSQKSMKFLFLDRVLYKKDNLIVVTGIRGVGKTTIALKILRGLNDEWFESGRLEKEYNEQANKRAEVPKKYKLEGFEPFNLKTDMAFTRDALQEMCKSKRQGFILGDEAITNVARRNSMTKANRILHEIFTINRKNGNTVFLCLPSIEDFDLSMLQYVTHWIHIDERGLGAVLLPEMATLFGKKRWDIEKMKKIYMKFKDDNPSAQTVPYWLFDNFRGYIRFKAMSKSYEEIYLKIADAKKNADTDAEKKAREDARPKKIGGIDDETKEKLLSIAQTIKSGELIDSAEYYANCGELGFTKDKLNKQINELLAQIGDGRTATQGIRENKKKDEDSYKNQIMAKRIIY